MIERTALEIALDLDAASCSSFAKLEAAEALRQQHAEIERLKAALRASIETEHSRCISICISRIKSSTGSDSIISGAAREIQEGQMSLHDEIIAITVRFESDNAFDLVYGEGHRDARHAAAELAIKADAEIERLKADAERVNSCAKNLAIAMHRKNFSNITQWEPLPDTMGLISQIDNMSCWHDAEIDRLKRERQHVYDLLARIHRDGGQYTAEHGVEKACDDAEAQVVAWLVTINGIDALIEQARIPS